VVVLGNSHEASPSCDHDILDVWPWLKLGSADEYGGLPPDPIVLEEAVWLANALNKNPKSAQLPGSAFFPPFFCLVSHVLWEIGHTNH
jgi:hypothetical protein